MSSDSSDPSISPLPFGDAPAAPQAAPPAVPAVGGAVPAAAPAAPSGALPAAGKLPSLWTDEENAVVAACRLADIPVRDGGPDHAWDHRDLYDNVIKALYAVPGMFQSDLNITGVQVPDLPGLNSVLGASIEQAVVDTLNASRHTWDPDNKYLNYVWERHAQAFPDVRLTTEEPGATPVLMGIELKGYFVMSKELEPSFRFLTTEAACAPADLLVMYPWHLNQVISGKPKLMRPWIEEARYAARMRNYYWQHKRRGTPVTSITLARGVGPYPGSKSNTNDEADRDSGNNFGRLARSRMMDEYLGDLEGIPLAGLKLKSWTSFLKACSPFDQAEYDKFVVDLRAELHGTDHPDAMRALAEAVLDRM